MKRHLAVTRFVADIRRKPSEPIGGYVHDDFEETQVLYNEHLLCKDWTEDWYYVEAIEQQKSVKDDEWKGYPGWVRKDSVAAIDRHYPYDITVKERSAFLLEAPSEHSGILLSVPLGTRLTVKESTSGSYYAVLLCDGRTGWIKKSAVNKKDYRPALPALRRSIVSTARLFIGTPYMWGGRSIAGSGYEDTGTAVTFGVDCSSLTNLVFRANNIDIPRDAHDQWIMAEKIKCSQLAPGDLIFLSAKDEIDKIVHVMLYIGENRFIEAQETGSSVQIGSFEKKYGMDMAGIINCNFSISGNQMHFGRFVS